MNEFFPWIAGAALLATIQTGGGAGIGRDVEAGRDFVGHDQIIHADRGEWRRYVDDKMRQNQDDIMDLRRAQNYQWIALALMAVIFLFALTISSGVIVRQFDLLGTQIERQFDRIDRRLDGVRTP